MSITAAIAYDITEPVAPIATVRHCGFKQLGTTLNKIHASQKYFSQTAASDIHLNVWNNVYKRGKLFSSFHRNI